jgi:hypothetical protein
MILSSIIADLKGRVACNQALLAGPDVPSEECRKLLRAELDHLNDAVLALELFGNAADLYSSAHCRALQQRSAEQGAKVHKAMELGADQSGVLKSLTELKSWYPGCGWIWKNLSITTRVLNSLVRRGLAERVPTSFTKCGFKYIPKSKI